MKVPAPSAEVAGPPLPSSCSRRRWLFSLDGGLMRKAAPPCRRRSVSVLATCKARVVDRKLGKRELRTIMREMRVLRALPRSTVRRTK